MSQRVIGPVPWGAQGIDAALFDERNRKDPGPFEGGTFEWLTGYDAVFGDPLVQGHLPPYPGIPERDPANLDGWYAAVVRKAPLGEAAVTFSRWPTDGRLAWYYYYWSDSNTSTQRWAATVRHHHAIAWQCYARLQAAGFLGVVVKLNPDRLRPLLYQSPAATFRTGDEVFAALR